MGKLELLRKREDVEGDKERMSILSSRILFLIPATNRDTPGPNPSIRIIMGEFFAGSFQCCL